MLIQKDVKRGAVREPYGEGLRALLIQKDVKLPANTIQAIGKFESFVNSERCKTKEVAKVAGDKFESFVNSERCKTLLRSPIKFLLFESFVNSERCKTI